jgi:hypothetical protein
MNMLFFTVVKSICRRGIAWFETIQNVIFLYERPNFCPVAVVACTVFLFHSIYLLMPCFFLIATLFIAYLFLVF